MLTNKVSKLFDDVINKLTVSKFKEIEKSVGEKIKKYYKTECPHCKKKADVMYNFHVKYVYDNNKKART